MNVNVTMNIHCTRSDLLSPGHTQWRNGGTRLPTVTATRQTVPTFYLLTHQDVFESIPPRAAEKVEGCPEVRVGYLGLDSSTGLVPKTLLLGSVATQS